MGDVPKFTVGDRVYWGKDVAEDPPIPPDCGTVTGIARKLTGFKYTVQFDEQDSLPLTLYDEDVLHELERNNR